MKRPSDIHSLEERIGYRFKNWDLLALAITHCSIKNIEGQDNQRLEFLGDRVLGLVIAERLIADHSEAPPGELSPRLNALVSQQSCADVARLIDLDKAIRVGRSASKKRQKLTDGIIGDAIEAVIGAIFIDAGFDTTQQVVERLWNPLISQNTTAERDAKSRLQIWAQSHRQSLPLYQLVDRSGPAHKPRFFVKVTLESGENSTADGPSKQRAELKAAQELLEKVERDDA